MKQAVTFWILLGVKWFQKNILDPILNLTLGYSTRHGWQKEVRSCNKYETSAQRVKIWARGAYTPAGVHTPGNFLYSSIEYLNPNYVLNKDHITLQGVNEKYAWFCVTDPSIDVYNLNMFPFVWAAQYVLAQELVIMPIWALHKLADELPDPGEDGREVIALTNTARSGSTLLCQMFHKLPRTRSMSEPWAPTVAHTYYVQGKITHQGNEYEKILKSVMKVQLKPEVNQTYDRIFFKLTVWCSGQVDLVKKACPKIKFVFNTRNPKSNLISFYQMGMSPVVADALEFDSTRIVHRLCPMPVNDPTGRFKLLRDNLLLKFWGRKDMDKIGTLAYGLTLINYVQHKECYDDIIIYDDLLEDPKGRTVKLFTKLGMIKDGDNEELVDLALKALDKDSQMKFFGKKTGELSDHHWQRMDSVLEDLELPIRHDTPLDEFRKLMADPSFS